VVGEPFISANVLSPVCSYTLFYKIKNKEEREKEKRKLRNLPTRYAFTINTNIQNRRSYTCNYKCYPDWVSSKGVTVNLKETNRKKGKRVCRR
jgi:hypothetical protein